MKKLYYYFLILLLIASVNPPKADAQIPNPSFEYWTAGNPDSGWTTFNVLDTFVVKVADAHAGNWAAKSQVLYNSFLGNLASPIISGTAADSGRFACNCRPEALHFWYKFYPAGVPGDEFFEAFSAAYQGGYNFDTPAGIGDGDTVLTYKEGVINYTNYLTNGNADSMSIFFLIDTAEDVGAQYALGTYFIIDDLSFGAAVGIQEQPASLPVTLEQNSPNPSPDRTNIVYSIPSPARVTLDIYDLTGRKVKSVLNERQSPGRYKAIVELSDMPAGNYLYCLNASGTVLTKKMVVVK